MDRSVMKISDVIADFIQYMLREEDGQVELSRGELAERFNCVPSQINYVIETRFSPEHGYFVESRRGGGGYIRIRRVQVPKAAMLMHTINAVGDEISLKSCEALLGNLLFEGIVSEREARLIRAAVSERTLSNIAAEVKSVVRAHILKNMLIALYQ